MTTPELLSPLTLTEKLLDLVPFLMVQNIDLAIESSRNRTGVISDGFLMPLAVSTLHRSLGVRSEYDRLIPRLEPYGLAVQNHAQTNHPMMNLGGALVGSVLRNNQVDKLVDTKGGASLDELLIMVNDLFSVSCTFVANKKDKQRDVESVNNVIRYYDVVSGQLERALKKVK